MTTWLVYANGVTSQLAAVVLERLSRPFCSVRIESGGHGVPARADTVTAETYAFNRRGVTLVPVLWKLSKDPRPYVRAHAVFYFGGAYFGATDPPVSEIE